MYGAFARVYDALMDTVDYRGWAEHYRCLMAAAGVKDGARVTECACGTGSMTIPLKKMGYQITGVDVSEDMLARAMEKARAAGVTIPFVRQDMRTLALPSRTDCLLATCDGVNYLDTAAKAQAFFSAAFRALRPGGALIFDVSTPEKLSGILGGHTLFSDDEEISYIWRNRWDAKNARLTLGLSLFVRRPDGAYDRLDEKQTQRAHSRQELRAWLSDAGFSDIRFYGRMRLSPPRTGDDRWHVSALRV